MQYVYLTAAIFVAHWLHSATLFWFNRWQAQRHERQAWERFRDRVFGGPLEFADVPETEKPNLPN